MEQQLTCARYVLAGVRGSGDVAAYLELLKSAEMGGWGGDIDDAFDAAYAGDRDDDGSSSLHDESMLSELSDAAARVIESSSQASSPPSSPPLCVLPHWPCAPHHLSCVCEPASVLPSPCYWLSLISSVRVKEGHEGDRVGAHHIHEAIRRWSAHASSVASISASASASASPASSSSICALSHHVALEIYSNVSCSVLSPHSFPSSSCSSCSAPSFSCPPSSLAPILPLNCLPLIPCSVFPRTLERSKAATSL
jgi:hypothetical protein